MKHFKHLFRSLNRFCKLLTKISISSFLFYSVWLILIKASLKPPLNNHLYVNTNDLIMIFSVKILITKKSILSPSNIYVIYHGYIWVQGDPKRLWIVICLWCIEKRLNETNKQINSRVLIGRFDNLPSLYFGPKYLAIKKK